MYNRYVPQADGSYRRNRMQEQNNEPEQKKEPEHPQPPPVQPQPEPKRHQQQPVGGFLRQLLPKDFDTADLIIMLLLLLLAGDCEEDRATAMLTLVLYLFM